MLEVVTPERQKFTSENEIKLVFVFQNLKDKKRILILCYLIRHVEFKHLFHNFCTEVLFFFKARTQWNGVCK